MSRGSRSAAARGVVVGGDRDPAPSGVPTDPQDRRSADDRFGAVDDRFGAMPRGRGQPSWRHWASPRPGMVGPPVAASAMSPATARACRGP